MNSSDLDALTQRSLSHFAGYVVRRGDVLYLDSDRLGEPSGIAHSAFFMLALLESDFIERDRLVVGLAAGILHQQRADGSYRTFFGRDGDEGFELYPGEAMLALLQAYSKHGDPRLLESAERGFRFYAERFFAGAVDPELLVFFANWQVAVRRTPSCADREPSEPARSSQGVLEVTLHAVMRRLDGVVRAPEDDGGNISSR